MRYQGIIRVVRCERTGAPHFQVRHPADPKNPIFPTHAGAADYLWHLRKGSPSEAPPSPAAPPSPLPVEVIDPGLAPHHLGITALLVQHVFQAAPMLRGFEIELREGIIYHLTYEDNQ